MLRNDLKEKLGEDWRSKFSHRDCDQADYEFSSFEVDGKKINLVLNPNTLDIMEYYFDDFSGKIPVSKFIESMGYKEKNNRKYYVDKDYNFFSNDRLRGNLLTNFAKVHKRTRYPEIGMCVLDKDENEKVICPTIHRLVAVVFVPNKDESVYKIINHKDKDCLNFRKENLEWCDYSENNSQENKKTYEFKVLYKRLSDNKTFTPIELKKEYNDENAAKNIRISLNNNKEYKGNRWEIINIALEDYISRHPIDKNGWHDDNGLHDFGKHKVRANNCGVLEVDGKLTVGHFRKDVLTYTITINTKAYLLSRLVFEIINHRLIAEEMVIDHIKPSTKEDVNNSIYNLREVTQSENMKNTETRKTLSKQLISFDLFGKRLKTYNSEDEAVNDLKLHKSEISQVLSGTKPQINSIIFLESEDELKNRTDYMYYRINKDGVFEAAHIHFAYVFHNFVSNKRNRDKSSEIKLKYLNTGMPAPDGYYYQQGTPGEMIYDPDNTKLEKKRSEIHWKYKQRKRDRDRKAKINK